jgi:hypothetical protein
MRLGIMPRRCYANSLWEPIPATVGDCATWPVSAPWHCAAHSRTANVPRPRRGPATSSNPFLVTLQGQSVTLGRRDAIPATVGPVRLPPCLQHHAGHCHNNSSVVGHVGTGRRHACHCTPYGSLSTASSSLPEDATANRYAFTLETAPVQVWNVP